MNAPMDWELLRTFAEVARQQSFTGAARVLGVHHSTVSRQMSALELTLKTRLFDKQGRGVELTPAAERLRTHAIAMEERAYAAVREVAGQDVQLEGSVGFTTTDDLLPLVMPLLGSFRSQFPSVELDIDIGASFRDLGRREADVAFRASRRAPDDTIAHRVSSVAWAVFARRAGLSGWVDLRRAYGGAPPPPPGATVVTVSSVQAGVLAIRQGLGPGPLPCFLGRAHPELIELEPIPEAEPGSLWVLVHPDLRRTARVRALVTHLRSGLGSLFSIPGADDAVARRGYSDE